ncbi:hypothetical protein E2C01_044906 [Portunus trituberculatus]|uniref:Uncharacterized protein n=1 Tax=Portunus trituberculatus TaxID=210409 RepID=A0A5B7G0P9_PORTR|nr:hypothetical protein [Portunus trituberculatus]
MHFMKKPTWTMWGAGKCRVKREIAVRIKGHCCVDRSTPGREVRTRCRCVSGDTLWRARRVAQATLCERSLPVHSSNLPRQPISKPKTGRDNIVPPYHKAVKTVGVFVAADRLVVGD